MEPFVEQGRLQAVPFNLSGRWLKSRAKASTGDAPAFQLALQAPIVLSFEEKHGVQICSRIACILIGAAHDERYDLLGQTMI